MAAVTLLGTQTWNTTAGNKTVTATPALDDLIVVIAGASGTSEANAATTSVTDNNSSGTYYKVADSLNAQAGSSPRISVWIRTALIGSAVSTIFTAAQASSSGGGLAVFKVTGMTRTGLYAARQAHAAFASGSGTPAIAMGRAALTGNALIGGIVNGSTAPILTEPTSWTERSDASYATPTTGIETASIDSGFTGSTVTWGSSSGTAWRGVVVELDTRALSAITLASLGVGG